MTKKKGLGRGIGNFLANTEKIEDIINEDPDKTYLEVKIDDIIINPNQPRKYFDEKSINELAKSIENYGVIQPLIVRKELDSYFIISGERRYRAAKKAGLIRVPVIIKEVSDLDLDKISLIENIQREDLNPIEEAKSYKFLIEKYDTTQKELSEELGKSRQYIGNTMRLLNLDERVIKFIEDGKLSMSHGKVLLSIKDKNEQYKKALKILKDEIPVAKTSNIVKKSSNIDLYLKNIRDELSSSLGTKVDFKGKGKKKKIEIEYYSEEDLSRICEIILGREI